MNTNILRLLGFNEEVDRVQKGLCPFCNKPPGSFRDELSLKEYRISGLCQKCQDDFFGSKE